MTYDAFTDASQGACMMLRSKPDAWLKQHLDTGYQRECSNSGLILFEAADAACSDQMVTDRGPLIKVSINDTVNHSTINGEMV